MSGPINPGPGGFQTTFGHGQDHFSQDHANHHYGSTVPIQRDFGLNMPNGRFQKLESVPSPPSVLPFQTTLDKFRR